MNYPLLVLIVMAVVTILLFAAVEIYFAFRTKNNKFTEVTLSGKNFFFSGSPVREIRVFDDDNYIKLYIASFSDIPINFVEKEIIDLFNEANSNNSLPSQTNFYREVISQNNYNLEIISINYDQLNIKVSDPLSTPRKIKMRVYTSSPNDLKIISQ